jgi:hypothetical protein
MGVLDELEAHERAQREPTLSRVLRRVGGGLALAAALMCLLGVVGNRWWTVEFDTGPISVGLGEMQYCETRGRCEELRTDEFVGFAISRMGPERAPAVEAWLGRRSYARASLGAAMLAALALAAMAMGPRRRPRTRAVALVAGILTGVALVFVYRFGISTPFDLMQRDTHAHLALLGLLDLGIACAMVGLPAELPSLPTARVVGGHG